MKELKRRAMPVDTSDTGGATSNSDGLSLEQGSSAYQELIADRMGIDESMQEDLRLGVDEVEGDDLVKGRDKWHDKVARRNIKLSSNLAKAANSVQGKAGVQREVRQQIRRSLTEEYIEQARKRAKKTETKEDDIYVERRLPKLAEKHIYNDADGLDDFYPGSRILNKFK